MDLNELNKANIDNLTGLWKKMGTQPGPCFNIEGLNASASWPNRYWFDWDTDANQIPVTTEILVRLPRCGIVPVWGSAAYTPSLLEQTMIEVGFEVLFEQTAMYLALENYIGGDRPAADIKRIHSLRDIETWTNIASEAFGYEIDVSVIHKIADDPDLQLLLAYSGGRTAATAMLYKTADIIGVHQVGVAKRYQGKGIAFSLLQHVIEACDAWQGKYITLQASAAGEGLYRRLGFEEQFKIRSYRRV